MKSLKGDFFPVCFSTLVFPMVILFVCSKKKLLKISIIKCFKWKKKKRNNWSHPWSMFLLLPTNSQPNPLFLPGEIPWTEEPGRLQSMGLQRVGHDWATYTFTFTFHWVCSYIYGMVIMCDQSHKENMGHLPGASFSYDAKKFEIWY